MAHIEIKSWTPKDGAQLFVNGVDFSRETFANPEQIQVVEVGEGDFAEAGLQVTFALSRLDLDDKKDVVIDHPPGLTERIRAMVQAHL